jgi:hypothetical protein
MAVPTNLRDISVTSPFERTPRGQKNGNAGGQAARQSLPIETNRKGFRKLLGVFA